MSEDAHEPYAPPQARTLERGKPRLSSHEAALRLAYKLAAHYLRVALFVLGGSALSTLAAIAGPSGFRAGYFVAGLLVLVGGFVVLVLGVGLSLAALAIEWTRDRRLIGFVACTAGLLSGGLLILPFLLFVRSTTQPPAGRETEEQGANRP